ncbi:MAG TPA: hypothetical protein VNM67_06035 [Thermoanaerobaculia bacterium]|jgi:hypothetical protein|nr:hypothetical protein [Thermoanaerobaculia bacterium]
MRKLLTLALVCIALGAFAGESIAQEEEKPPILKKCPKPYQQHVVNLTAPPPAGATPHLPDFPATCVMGWEPIFGGTTQNKCFRHTFTWKSPKPECRCWSAQLTIRYQALFPGANASDNDNIAFFSGGVPVPGTVQPLYTGGAPAGQILTKTIPVSCDLLKNNRLSFLVQDDTSVISATLRIVYCCGPCPKGEEEITFPGKEIKYCCKGKPGDDSFCCTAQKKPGAGN